MDKHKEYKVKIGRRVLKLGSSPTIMGILNVTPDSFSDGGLHKGPYSALEHARKMLMQGAHIIDVGGESTRPEAVKVFKQEELDRIMPFLTLIKEHEPNAIISIDSYKAEVAKQAVLNGAKIVNDVNGLQGEPEMAEIVADFDVAVIIMHWDKKRNRHKDIMGEIKRFFEKSLKIAQKARIKKERIILDPGFGFAKSFKENYEILRRLEELHNLGFPILIGTSNKSMIGHLLDIEVHERLAGTIATNIIGYEKGAHIFRVHNIEKNMQALKVAHATKYGP